MIDFISKHFTPLLYAAGIVLFVAVVLAAILFHELSVHYERTRKAALRFVQIVLGLRLAVKGDATADDALAKTMAEPMKAVENPRASGEKKP